jgi:ATP-dependent Clp protease ATP-binding subunit ClpC
LRGVEHAERFLLSFSILSHHALTHSLLLSSPLQTAIAEGLATAIVSGTLPDGDPLPPFLAGKRILSLDLGLVLAGAKERGELESRITKMLAEIQAAGDVILVIDEIHALVGAGSIGGRGGGGGGGGMDIANLLKPPLARGLLQCIGATTLDEHRKHIERDPALERRFQPVVVGEPTEAEALEILEGLAPRYEAHHRCVYAPGALAAAVSLSSRYVADRFLPDKAIDLMDEAGSRARIDAYLARRAGGARGVDANGAETWAELEASMAATADAARAGLFEEAGVLADRERGVRARLVGEAGDAPGVPAVTRKDIEAIVAQWTRVPVEALGPDDTERLLNLGPTLAERVIGQGAAVAAVARAMQRSRAGLKDEDRPIAGMLFAGPTGVGKTELTRALCEHIFGDRDAMVRLDMSEYMERHTVAKLIGAPPGYVGYGEGGKLTEAVRRRPYTVVLFDEIEKAHPDVFNVLLQVLEDGRLTDSGGRVVSFKNTLIIMTSNVGSAVIGRGGGRGIGFDLSQGDADEGAAAYGRVRSLVLEELKAFFRPELLNRLDEVVVFRQLAQEDARAIADLELASTAARVAARGLHLEITAALMDRIVSEGYDQEYGARPLRRAIVRLVDDALSDALLHGRLEEGDIAVMDVDAASGETTVTPVKPYVGVGGGGPGPPSPSFPSGSPALTGDVRSEIVYSSLSARRAAKEAAEKEAARKAEDVRA